MRNLCLSVFLIAASAAARPAAASTSDMRVPSLGVVYDRESKAVLPIAGMPGAAVLGAPLDFGFPVESAAASAQLDYALAVSADDGRVRLVRLQNSAAATVLEVISAPDRMVLSASARAAVLYSRAAARLQVIGGLPEAPAVSREIATDRMDIAELAVSDDGEVVAAISRDGHTWRLNVATGEFEMLLEDAASAVAFRPGSREAIVAARAGEIYSAGRSGISKLGLLPRDAVAVQGSSDGARAYAAYGDGTLAVLDAQTGAVKSISCGCRPSGLSPIRPGMYRLNEPSADVPLMLLDVSPGEPRVWFIPASRRSE